MSVNLLNVIPIDDDFEQAAAYYSSTALGREKNTLVTELKRRYHEDETLDPLVFTLAKHRYKHAAALAENVVFKSDAHKGIAWQMTIWFGLPGRLTPRRLFAHLELCSITPPDWLVNDPDMQDLDTVTSKQTQIRLFHQAILHDNQIDTLARLHETSVSTPPIPCTCISDSQHDAYSPGGPMSGHRLPPPCKLHPNG